MVIFQPALMLDELGWHGVLQGFALAASYVKPDGVWKKFTIHHSKFLVELGQEHAVECLF